MATLTPTCQLPNWTFWNSPQFHDDLEVKDRKSKMSRGDDEDEDEDEEDAMDISETKRCYVYGQCQVGSHYQMILGREI